MIPFSPPRVDDQTITAVTEVLKSGWITTGPVTKQFEQDLAEYLNLPKVLCLNSWTNAAELFLRWYGIKEGDEVIVPAYTYSASCNILFHLGATPVLVDCAPNSFHIDIKSLEEKITAKTKVIMPVDIGGFPCDYESISKLIERKKNLFHASSPSQEILGRILLFSDAAHSLGSKINDKPTALFADVSCYSFHAVKNLTTAEGGALAFNLPNGFDYELIYKELNIMSLHGQTKDALSKTTSGGWKYDITSAGYKCNMTDLQAAIGAVELERYENSTLPKRKKICMHYHESFSAQTWYISPPLSLENSQTSYHLFQLRIKSFTEQQRDEAMELLKAAGVSTNVHFMPLPLFSFYQKQGFKMADYPNAFHVYANEISLPVFYDLSEEQMRTVSSAVVKVINQVLGV
ncbi:MAG: DegT/DnrJ/EryC1/StrS family aminotransferase [Flavobacteriales bacterium]